MARLSYKEQIQRVREDAIVEAVNRLLATKGYDAMTVDEVAAEAGNADGPHDGFLRGRDVTTRSPRRRRGG